MSIYKYSDLDTLNCFYADVLFKDKDIAKALGAKWNPVLKKWYFTSKRERHDWDIKHSDYISDEAKRINEFVYYNDLFYTIYNMLNDKDCKINTVDSFTTYEKLVNYLLEKYGPVPASYFTEDYKSNWKINSRTNEGLEIHHIDEDKYLYLSSVEQCKKQNVPFECHCANRLVYCNKIEHLLLHIRIAEDFHQDELHKYYTYGIKTLISKINDYYEYDELPGDWQDESIKVIKGMYTYYVILLLYISAHLTHDMNMLFDDASNIISSSRKGQTITRTVNEFNRIATILNQHYNIEPNYIANVFCL